MRHAVRVASGLDSMVLGEGRRSWSGSELIRFVRLACRLAGYSAQCPARRARIRAQVKLRREGGSLPDRIGANSVSMAAAAVRLTPPRGLVPDARGHGCCCIVVPAG